MRMGLQPSDVLFFAIVIWIALEIIDGDWGGGKRLRVPIS
jgi:hypothetical protein